MYALYRMSRVKATMTEFQKRPERNANRMCIGKIVNSESAILKKVLLKRAACRRVTIEAEDVVGYRDKEDRAVLEQELVASGPDGGDQSSRPCQQKGPS